MYIHDCAYYVKHESAALSPSPGRRGRVRYSGFGFCGVNTTVSDMVSCGIAMVSAS